jgi:signal transduction histidine kinase
MRLPLPKKLPQRVTLIWALMAVPVLAIAAFSVLAIARFPQFTSEFEYYWKVGGQVDEISRLMANAKVDREILNSMRQSEPSEALQARVAALREKISDFAVEQPIAELKPLTAELLQQTAAFENSVIELEAARLPLYGSGLAEKVERLRTDATTVLDPIFLQKVNEIADIAQVFSCASRMTASRLLREDVDILLSRLATASLPMNERIQVHSNASAIRGEFAATLLACQDLERSFERAVASSEQTSLIVAQLNLETNASILAKLDSRMRSETLSLMTLFGAVIGFFAIGSAGTYVLSRRFGTQLAHMTQAIRGVANNQQDVAIPFVGAQDEFGELAGNVITFQRNAETLRHALQEARQASDAKTRFLATVSHELRTPLNAILGFSEMIQNSLMGPLSERYREYGRDIHQSAHVLLEQISQILDLSRVEMGQIDVHAEATEVNDTIDIALKRLEGRLRAKKITVDHQLAASVHAWFDRRHLYQIISNVLDNAVKYNVHGGRIEITQLVAENEISVTISDSGTGMRADEVERAHEPFVQFGRSTDSLQGIGLGLSIVQRLTVANNASFRIQSEQDKGTRVTITMPLARALQKKSVA